MVITMKMLHHVLVFIFLMSATIHAQNSDTRKMLGVLVQELGERGDWKSKSAVPKLEDILKKSTEANEVLTANILLAFYLTDAATSIPEKDPTARIRSICSLILKDAPNSWQGTMAQILLVAERDFAGDRKKEIAMATTALAKIDFDALETNKDPAWLAIRKTLGNRPYVLKDMLNFSLANAFCAQNRFSEAEQVLGSLSDEKYTKVIHDRIELGKKTHKKH
jgi:hypothetical protein